jgi:hypothetical protein
LTFSETDTCRFSDYTFSQLSHLVDLRFSQSWLRIALSSGCNAVQFSTSSLAFRSNVMLPCWGLYSKPSNKPAGGRWTSVELHRVTAKKPGLLLNFHLIKINVSNKQLKELLLNIKEDNSRSWRSLKCSLNCPKNNFMEWLRNLISSMWLS